LAAIVSAGRRRGGRARKRRGGSALTTSGDGSRARSTEAPQTTSNDLLTEVGNPEGPDRPNKKYFDPRGWLHIGEQGITERLLVAYDDLGSREKFDF